MSEYQSDKPQRQGGYFVPQLRSFDFHDVRRLVAKFVVYVVYVAAILFFLLCVHSFGVVGYAYAAVLAFGAWAGRER